MHVFCICTCSAQTSIFNMQRCTRNTIIIIITTTLCCTNYINHPRHAEFIVVFPLEDINSTRTKLITTLKSKTAVQTAFKIITKQAFYLLLRSPATSLGSLFWVIFTTIFQSNHRGSHILSLWIHPDK